MGKQRTPQDRPSGRSRRPDRNVAAKTIVEAAGEPGVNAPILVSNPDVSARDAHDHLVETVSPQALQVGTDKAVATEFMMAEPPVAEDPYNDESAPAEPAGNNIVKLALPVPAVRTVPTATPAEVEAAASSLDAKPPNSAPAAWRASSRQSGVLLRQDIEGMGETLFAFLRGEGTAAVSHLRALSGARSPADAVRLQVGEIQRAADASLTVWADLAHRFARIASR